MMIDKMRASDNKFFTTGIVWIAFVVLISSMIPHSSYATVIRLREKATAKSALVTLGDVAEISEVDEDTVSKLKRITLAPAPAPGRNLRINLDRVRRELTLRGIDQSNISFLGSSETLIIHQRLQAKSRSAMQGDQLEKVQQSLVSSIKKYLQSRSADLNTIHVEISLEQARQIAPFYVWGSPIDVRGGQSPWTGAQQFQIQFIDRNNQSRNIPLFCKISLKQQALALKLGLPRGKVIRESDLIWVTPDYSLETKPVFTKLEDVVGTETIKNIRAQRPIHPEDVRQLPLVKRNDIVAVTARVGGVSVRRYCRSHGEGAKGQFVTLTPIDGKAKVTARVSGFREAEIVIDSPLLPAEKKQTIQRAARFGSERQVSNRPVQISHPAGNSRKNRSGSIRPASFQSNSIQVQIQANRPVRLP